MPAETDSKLKRAIILDEDEGFIVEYDNNIGTRNIMRLEAASYDDAIEEIKSFLGINGDLDEQGNRWEIE